MNKQDIDNIMRDLPKYVKKWEPVMRAAGMSNNTLIELLSCYAEYFQVVSQSNIIMNTSMSMSSSSTNGYGYSNNTKPIELDPELGTNLMKIIDNIKKLPNIRIKVENTSFYYNSFYNKYEYRLENGEFITTTSETPGLYTGKLSRIDIIAAFPDDFIKLLDMSEFREMRLNSIIN